MNKIKKEKYIYLLTNKYLSDKLNFKLEDSIEIA